MNRTSIICGSLVTLIALTGGRAQADTDEQAVTAAEHQWLKSQLTNNVDLLAPLLADNVVETSAEGKTMVGKEAVLADAKSQKWTSADYKDLKVAVLEHTAVATGTFVGKGADSAGKALNEHVRFTDTWVKTAGGKWLCLASHDSPIKK